jgi:hypothetical protein
MTSSARKKIDPQSMQLFDVEVDRPEHDEILTTLFQDTSTLQRLLRELHDLPELKAFGAESKFSLIDYSDGRVPKNSEVSFDEATKLANGEPSWSSLSPVRIAHKELEVLLDLSSKEGKYSRLIGFIDICVSYKVVRGVHLERNSRAENYDWVLDADDFCAMIEIKGQWPTAGNLLRQLNLYRASDPRRFNGRLQHLVVGPDTSMHELVAEHGYRLAVFDKQGKEFTLIPRSPTQSSVRKKGVL